MIKMLIIADDFTGALDTGVKFSAAGFITKVVTDSEIDFAAETAEEVLVLCVPTRHIPPKDAYSAIRAITERAVAAGIHCIFKKTDSALRGNIGAEISAVLDGSGQRSISFIPALPAVNRTTRAGVHYIDGVPVHESVFGKDPFEPVTESYVPDLLRRQCDVPIHLVSRSHMEQLHPGQERCIYVFDCTTREDLEAEVRMLYQHDQLKVLAGCAGLAESLPPYLGISQEKRSTSPAVNRLMVVCGSINPISCAQMDYAERHGFQRIHIPTEQLLDDKGLTEGAGRALIDQLWKAFCLSEYLIIDTQESDIDEIVARTSLTREEIRQRFSSRIGAILKTLMDRGADSRFLIVGGDTLLAFMEAIHCREIYPVCELQPGVVYSRIAYGNRKYEVISKSGGFGEKDILVALQDMPPIERNSMDAVVV